MITTTLKNPGWTHHYRVKSIRIKKNILNFKHLIENCVGLITPSREFHRRLRKQLPALVNYVNPIVLTLMTLIMDF